MPLTAPGAVDGGQPGCVEDLDEGADGVRGEEGGVEDGGEGAEVECAGAGGGGGGREDEVHGCAHCLHDFWWEVFKANHGCWLVVVVWWQGEDSWGFIRVRWNGLEG